MFPAATSLIPVTVALVRFIEAGGSVWENYPYWYLGTTPMNYLIGPLPLGTIMILHNLLDASLFNIAFLVVIFALIFGSVGWGILAWKLSQNRKIGVVVGLVSIIMPSRIVWGLALSDVSATMAASLTPWVILAGARIFNFKFSIINLMLAAVVFGVLLLVNTTASIPAIIGLFILGIVLEKRAEEGIKRALIVIIGGWFLTLWWYPLDYWLTVWGAPSLGGRSVFGAIGWIVSNLRNILPILLAIIIVKFGFAPKSRFLKFVSYWLLAFGFLTFMRFLADWDFWMDWTAWIWEVEIGFALLFGYAISRGSVSSFLPAYAKASAGRPASDKSAALPLEAKRSGVGILLTTATPKGVFHEMKSKSHVFEYLETIQGFGVWSLVIGVLIVGWSIAFVKRDFWLPRMRIDDTVEYRVAKELEIRIRGSIPQGADKASGVEPQQSPTVFLSGTTAFWLNSLVDVVQVRGGRDELSKDPIWRQAAWILRQGEAQREVLAAINKLGVDYLVVHDEDSSEFYGDFANAQIFGSMDFLTKIYEKNGDVIYKVTIDN